MSFWALKRKCWNKQFLYDSLCQNILMEHFWRRGSTVNRIESYEDYFLHKSKQSVKQFEVSVISWSLVYWLGLISKLFPAPICFVNVFKIGSAACTLKIAKDLHRRTYTYGDIHTLKYNLFGLGNPNTDIRIIGVSETSARDRVACEARRGTS